jgi:hypothetical protein
VKPGFSVPMVVLIVSAALLLGRAAPGQSTRPGSSKKPTFSCSPAPCALPPTQASEGGGTVTNPAIVSDPVNLKHLLLGSVDYNCSQQTSNVGFHLSTDGGSSWERVECMPSLIIKGKIWDAIFEPSLGYDSKGTAYIGGLYTCQGFCNGTDAGFIAVQKSSDGFHWSKPVVALRYPGQSFPFEPSMAVDTSTSSHRVNSVYVSGVIWSHQGSHKQVLVSHSTDGGVTWTQAAVDRVQTYPAQDFFTRMAIGGDGTVYLTWMHCGGTKNSICRHNLAHMMFAKSTDGGSTWSTPQRMATVTMHWELPNTRGERVYNYPVIVIDSSGGAYSGNLYVALYTWTGTYLRVQLIRSADGGKTWSKPVSLAPKSDTHDQFFPTVSVSATGLVGVSWLDRRNDPANHDYQAFAAISTDGGRTFGRNWQLTKAFSDPDTNGTQNNWMGDYTGNTWAGNKFIAAWMDSSNGVDMQEVIGGIRLK